MLINKTRITHTVDKKVVEKFNKLTQKLGSNKSKVIQILIEKWIKENDNIQNNK